MLLILLKLLFLDFNAKFFIVQKNVIILKERRQEKKKEKSKCTFDLKT